MVRSLSDLVAMLGALGVGEAVELDDLAPGRRTEAAVTRAQQPGQDQQNPRTRALRADTTLGELLCPGDSLVGSRVAGYRGMPHANDHHCCCLECCCRCGHDREPEVG